MNSMYRKQQLVQHHCITAVLCITYRLTLCVTETGTMFVSAFSDKSNMTETNKCMAESWDFLQQRVGMFRSLCKMSVPMKPESTFIRAK